jgi:hypothetical protein
MHPCIVLEKLAMMIHLGTVEIVLVCIGRLNQDWSLKLNIIHPVFRLQTKSN